MPGFDDVGLADDQLAAVVLRGLRLHPGLDPLAEHLHVGEIDAAVHEPERVGGAHHRIACDVEDRSFVHGDTANVAAIRPPRVSERGLDRSENELQLRRRAHRWTRVLARNTSASRSMLRAKSDRGLSSTTG